MSENNIYERIAKRTDGNIYIGVVGPVRSGKSTFIQRFMQSAVLPKIENEYDRERATDELPQCGSGKTITTTEPKFIPGEAIRIKSGEKDISIRLIDCVGYVVEGALGAMEGENWRTVMTPWSNEPIPFTEAAEIGTRKVAREHSTIALLVTTDGSIADIPRESYIEAEEKAVRELKEASKPFAIILNSKEAESDMAHSLARQLEEKYGAPVALVDCEKLDSKDIEAILNLVMGEFPIKELKFKLPDWTELIPEEHSVNLSLMQTVRDIAENAARFNDLSRICEEHTDATLLSFDAASGVGEFSISLPRESFIATMSECSGNDFSTDKELFAAVIGMAEAKKEYDKIKDALYEVKERGYGIVMPSADALVLSEPELVKQGSGYGIKVSAEAESIHLIKTKIRADVCPTFTSEEQSEEVIKHMNAEYEEDPKCLLASKMFGRSLYELVNDDMHAKLTHMPDESRQKMCQTLERIINEGAAGLICILV